MSPQPTESADPEKPSWTLEIHDFRGVRAFRWSPEGVCLLAGPNGAGKTTVLDAIAFLRALHLRGIEEAIRFAGGSSYLRRRGATRGSPVRLGLTAGRATWEVRLHYSATGLSSYDETITVEGQVRGKHEVVLDDNRSVTPRSALLRLWDNADDEERARLESLRGLVSYAGVYRNIDLAAVAGPQPGDSANQVLAADGSNAWNVLRSWKAASRRFDGQFEWVRDELKKAFPDLVDELEVDSIGQSVQARFYPPRATSIEQSLPMGVAAHGMRAGLLHLMAIAGAREGALVAVDEFELHLHPHAIRSLLAAIRQRAAERRLTVVLTSHSPVVMNEFRDHVNALFIVEPDSETSPVPLSELQEPEWLATFSLGDLYERGELGMPHSSPG